MFTADIWKFLYIIFCPLVPCHPEIPLFFCRFRFSATQFWIRPHLRVASSFPERLCRTGLCGQGACKSHPPFNLHTFRPCQSPPVFPPIWAALYSLPAWLKAVLRSAFADPKNQEPPSLLRIYCYIPGYGRFEYPALLPPTWRQWQSGNFLRSIQSRTVGKSC